MRPRLILAVSLIGFAGAACAKLAGIDDYRGNAAPEEDAANPASAAIVFADGTCGACVTAGCASELDSCQKDVACAGWEGCMAKCTPGDGPCEHACFTAAGSTNRTMGEISACTFRHCLGTCKATAGFSAYTDECGAAYRNDCPMPVGACAADDNCLEFIRCLFEENCVGPERAAASLPASPLSGVNPGCAWQCEDRVGLYDPVDAGPDGGLALNPSMSMFICGYFSSSYAQCGNAGLECVGHYSWPSTSATTVDVTVFVNDGGYAENPGAPVGGVSVRACRQGSAECIPAYGPQTTGADGRTVFNLPTYFNGAVWYFEVTTGWTNGPSKLLFDVGRPLTQDTVIALPTNAPDFSDLADPGSHYGAVGAWSSDRGALAVLTRGCDNITAKGLEISVDGDHDGGAASIAYFTSDGYTLSTAPSESTTGAYVASVQPGVRTVSAYKDGQPIAREKVVVEADALTYINWLEPMGTAAADQ